MKAMHTMKKATLLVSKRFPAKHTRAGQATNFKEKIERREKIHTIRDNYDWWEQKASLIQKGEMELCIRSWIDQPYNSKQEEWSRLQKIGLQKITMTYDSTDGYPKAFVEDKQIPIQELAMHDGLSVEDFIDWFFGSGKTNVYDGVIIHFTNFTY
jgi:hypothetical protein